MSLSERWRGMARSRLSQELDEIMARLGNATLPEVERERLTARRVWIEGRLGTRSAASVVDLPLVGAEPRPRAPEPGEQAGSQPVAAVQSLVAQASAEQPAPPEPPPDPSIPDFDRMSNEEVMRYLREHAMRDPDLRSFVAEVQTPEETSRPARPSAGGGFAGISWTSTEMKWDTVGRLGGDDTAESDDAGDSGGDDGDGDGGD